MLYRPNVSGLVTRKFDMMAYTVTNESAVTDEKVFTGGEEADYIPSMNASFMLNESSLITTFETKKSVRYCKISLK
jgi:hypothetical protein